MARVPVSLRRAMLLALALAAAGAAQSQTAPAKAETPAAAAEGARKFPLTEGKVVEVDAKEHRATLEHGRIENLGMDPMTMEFLVPDGKVLKSLKPGSKVRFAAIHKDGEYVITRVEAIKPQGGKKASRSSR